MTQPLKEFLESLKENTKIPAYSEAATKQALVLPILQRLDWNISDVEEVAPEYEVESRKVDFSLRVAGKNRVFLEVKKPSLELQDHEEQLLDYAFRQGVDIAVLTNGMTWSFYLPMQHGPWRDRRFYTIAIAEQDCQEAAQKFIDLLSRDNVATGAALGRAQEISRDQSKKRKVEEALPEAWNKLIEGSDPSLRDRLCEIAESICGFKVDLEMIKGFFEKYGGQFLVSPADEPPPPPLPPVPPGPRAPSPERKISEDELIPALIEILQNHGGRANKEAVEREIYQRFRSIFDHRWYHEMVNNRSVERWRHNLAWAKERAKRRGLVKSAEESGRGIWELTPAGLRWRNS